MINRFSYDYPEPAGERPIVIVADAASCPWAPAHHLVRIAVRGSASRLSGSDDVEVEFNPARVGSYRLIGFEKPMPAAAPSRDADEKSTSLGRAVTALYEVVPVRAPDEAEADAANLHEQQLVTVRLAHTSADGTATDKTEQTLGGAVKEFASASADFKFAAAVAEFAMILRDSSSRGDASITSVIGLAEAGRGLDVAGERSEFIALVRKAEALLASRG
jgi:Ca-activated chloride channel family protein